MQRPRIKVLKFLTMFAVGGTERQFTYVTRSLDHTRFDVRVGCLSREGEFLKHIEALNVPIAEYPIRSLCSTGMLRRQWRFAHDLRRERVQIVHAYGFYPNVFCVPAARFGGCRTIASVRDIGAFASHIKLRTLMQKTACLLADRVIANSTAVRDWLVGLGLSEKRIVTIPNGIALPEQRLRSNHFPIRQQFGIATDAPLIAVICRLNKNKGIEYFLQAATIVRKQFPKARFLIVGGSYFEPEYKPALERLAADMNLSDTVVFTGERNDIPDLLREIDISVLPSLSEGLSNSLLESMAAAVPVVATNVGGNPEIVHDGRTGLLVPPRNADALSVAIVRLLENPEMGRQFGSAGYERVKQNFSLGATVRRTEDLYLALLEERSWRHARPLVSL
jgi:glycosyltransferase involved in cell wall biosynthesis